MPFSVTSGDFPRGPRKSSRSCGIASLQIKPLNHARLSHPQRRKTLPSRNRHLLENIPYDATYTFWLSWDDRIGFHLKVGLHLKVGIVLGFECLWGYYYCIQFLSLSLPCSSYLFDFKLKLYFMLLPTCFFLTRLSDLENLYV